MKLYQELTNTGRARRLRVTAMRAAAEYGLDVRDLRQLSLHANHVFRLTTSEGERFVLRVQRPGLHQPIDTELELWWVQRLTEGGIPVAAVVPNLRGEVVTLIDGTSQVPDSQRCVLFEWLPGSDADENAPGFWCELGSLAARLHDHSAHLEVPAHFRRRRWDSVFAYKPPILFDARHVAVITAERSPLATPRGRPRLGPCRPRW
jgi:Ser/Thr protein kinase RdoA (MazF antagonist)